MEFETYRQFGTYEVGNMTDSKPSSFNSNIRVKRYKVTVEEVSTFKEECENIQRLWEEGDSWHHNTPIKNYAEKLGYELKGSFGEKVNR